jgi:hypothetical protein
MKKILVLFSAVGIIALQGCEGPMGPPGVPGPIFEAEVFEVTRSFGPNNDFSNINILNPPILNSDIVFVYLLWDVDGNTPIWRLMPQTVQLDEGDLQYNYDFTRFDVNLFLSSADFPLTILGPQWTQNQTFRIVIVPGYFASSARLDFGDYNAVMNFLDLKETDVVKK